MKNSARWIVITTITVMTACIVAFQAPIPQWSSYHHFADQRMIGGIPHFMDVVSNLPFLFVATLGFFTLRRQVKAGEFRDRSEIWPYLSFFAAVLLTAFGSSYYHLVPNNARLVWDRIPISIVAMSLVSIVLMEKAGPKTVKWSLIPLLVLGVGSVVYWSWTESLGHGDLRPYFFVQFYPVVAIGLILWLFPKPFPAANELVRFVVYYALAKAFETKDASVYEVTGLVSGHTIKHLLAAFSLYWVVRMLQKRKTKMNPGWRWGKFPLIILGVCAAAILGLVLYIHSMVVMPGDPHRPSAFMKRAVSHEDMVLRERLAKHVRALSKDIGIRHCQDPEAYEKLKAAADYVRLVWKSQGYEVKSQSYDVGREVENLYVEKRGSEKSSEVLVVGAHYDGVEDGPAANDNGSGVAALLELSAALANVQTSRTIQFVAFVNEEPPFFQTEAMGSRVYATRSAMNKENIIGMISLETIGCYSNEEKSQQYPWPFSLFYPERGNFIAFVGNYASRSWVRQCTGTFRKVSDFPSEGVAAPEFVQGIGWSDQWSFWQEGYPGLMVTDTAPYRYRYYHTSKDTMDKINFNHMARVVEGLQETMTLLAR